MVHWSNHAKARFEQRRSETGFTLRIASLELAHKAGLKKVKYKHNGATVVLRRVRDGYLVVTVY